jgi:hypothetical protein
MAKSEYFGCSPRPLRLGATYFQAAPSSSQIVTSPRRRSASFYFGQLLTAYFAFRNLPRRSAWNLCGIGLYFCHVWADFFADFLDPCNNVVPASIPAASRINLPHTTFGRRCCRTAS